MNKPVFNKDLIEKYDVRGPRYTSYPTAALFNSIKTNDYISSIRDSNEQILPSALSIYIHIPFCDTICYYCACTKIVTKDKSLAVDYVSHLLREFEIKSPLYDRDREVTQLHFGGGTPTFLDDDQFSQIFQGLEKNYTLSHKESRDFSIEIDPRTIDHVRLESLQKLGFNRLSFGVQDFNPKVQKAVNRIQSECETAELVKAASDLGFKSINIDLMYGLPFQTIDSFSETVAKVIKLCPDRLSVFNYAHMPSRFKPQRRIDEQDLPSPEQKLEMYRRTIDDLGEAGYRLIGMDHFALPEDDLCKAQDAQKLHRNFQGYSTHADCDLVSFGVSSISMLDDCYVQNVINKQEYYQTLEDDRLPLYRGIVLSQDDRLRRNVIMQLLCHFSLSKACIEQRFSIKFDRYFESEVKGLKRMQADGLLVVDAENITITQSGRLLVRAICMVFDRYLDTKEKSVYSRVI